MPVASTSTITPNHTLKKFKNLDDTATSMARSTVDQQPNLDFKQFIPKLISSYTFREDKQAQQSVAHLFTNMSSLSPSISNSLSEFKKLANTEAAVVCEATNQGNNKKPESTTGIVVIYSQTSVQRTPV